MTITKKTRSIKGLVNKDAEMLRNRLNLAKRAQWALRMTLLTG